MPALVGDLEREVLRRPSRSPARGSRAAYRLCLPAAAFVQAELGVDELAVILDQPLDAVVVAALLIGGQRENDVALGHEVLLLHAQQVGDEDRGHRLVVGGAAAVEVAVLFDELERIEIGRPVFAFWLRRRRGARGAAAA